jgi:hypothetical protein
MNTLEDRLREALSERARQSPVSDDAWARTVARARRRRPRASAWSRFMIPAAAAAAVIAIVVGASLLAGDRSPRGGSGSARPATTSPSATPPPPPGRNDYLMRQAPPVSAVVPVKLTIDGKITWTFVWFGYMKNARNEGIALCSVTDGGNYYGSGNCGAATVGAGKVAISDGGSGSIRLGTVIRQATSVTAVLGGGRRVPGVLAFGRGFPYKVWAVAYPQENNAHVVFADAGGHELGQVSFSAEYPAPPQPRSGGIVVFRYPAHVLEPTAGTMKAYLLDGRLVGVTGKVVGFWDSSSSSAIASRPASGSPAVVNMGGGIVNHAKLSEYYGYAHENVARVVLRLPGGAEYGAQTFAAWPGSGLRLWAFAVPSQALSVKPRQDVLLGYDAAGHVIWSGR